MQHTRDHDVLRDPSEEKIHLRLGKFGQWEDNVQALQFCPKLDLQNQKNRIGELTF